MSVSRCRHTFIVETSYTPWRRCNLCLLSILPFTECRYCANCDCYLHPSCHREIIEKIGQITENKAAHSPLAPRKSSSSSTVTTTTTPTTVAQNSSFDFSTYLAQQRDALLRQLPPQLRGGTEKKGQTKPAEGLTSSTVTTHHTVKKAPCAQHRFQLAEFFLPTRCDYCYVLKTPEEKSELEKRLTERESPYLVNQTVSKLREIPNSYLAFGCEGYLCTECGCTVHRPCVVCVKGTETPPYVIVSPPARAMEKEEKEIPTEKRKEDFLASLKQLFSQEEAAREKGETRKPSWILNQAKTLVTSYFGGGTAQHDTSMKVIVASVLKLMDRLVERHPALLETSTFNLLRLHTLSVSQEQLYLACCESLPDAAILSETLNPPTAEEVVEGAGGPPCISPTGSVQDVDILLALRDALRYAVAVYGESYRRGDLSSVVRAAMIFTIQREAMLQISDEDNNNALTDVLVLPRSSLRASHWAKRSNEPSYAVVVDTLSSHIVVTFRGTLSDTDILTDVCGVSDSFCGGRAHQGAALCVNYLFDHRASTLNRGKTASSSTGSAPPAPAPCSTATEDTTNNNNNSNNSKGGSPSPVDLPSSKEDEMEPDYLLDALQASAEEYPDFDIVITGHSLGGGIAVLLGVRLQYDKVFPPSIQQRISVVAYAAMPTLSLPAAEGFDHHHHHRPAKEGEEEPYPTIQIWNVVNGCDMIPRLQVNSIDRLCRLLSTTEGAKEEEEMKDLDQPVPPSDGSSGGIYPVPDDDVIPPHGEEEKEVVVVKGGEEKNPSSSPSYTDKDFTVELHHPGRVLLLTHPWDKNLNRLVEVPRGHLIMHEVFLVKTMFELHLIDSYASGLRYVRSRKEVEAYLSEQE